MACPSQEQECSSRRRKVLQGQHMRNTEPSQGGCSRRQQHVATKQRGKKRQTAFWLISIVENEKPVFMGEEPRLDRLYDYVLFAILRLGKIEHLCYFRVGCIQGF